MRLAVWLLVMWLHRKVGCDDARPRVARNYSPYAGGGAANELRGPDLGRTGPVLFPDMSTDPPTDRPLIVTSRPLVQRVQPEVRRVQPAAPDPYSNGYFFSYDPSERRSNLTSQLKHPYAGVAKKLKKLTGGFGARGYTSEERQTVVPPIYNALENYARTKVLKGKKRLRTKTRPAEDGIDDEYYNDNSGNEAKQYAFSYAVRDHQTGDDFSHSQRHSGSATNGEYRVKLPDGRLQIVSYTADNGGYKAEVRYEEDPDAQQEDEQVTYQNNQVLTSPSPPPQPRPETLGTIVVPSNEYQDYEVDFYYDEPTQPPPPKEVLITSKPAYYTSTQPNVYYSSSAGYDRYYTTPGYEDNSIAYVSSTAAPIDVYDQIDVPSIKAKAKAGQVRYTSTTPQYRVVQSTTPKPQYRVVQSTTQNPIEAEKAYYGPNGGNIDLRKYFSFGKR